jgi:hypothetical protein
MASSPAVSLDFPPYGRWEMTQTRQRFSHRLPYTYCSIDVRYVFIYYRLSSWHINDIRLCTWTKYCKFSRCRPFCALLFRPVWFASAAAARVLLFGFWLSRSLLQWCTSLSSWWMYYYSKRWWLIYRFRFAFCKIGVQNRTYNWAIPSLFLLWIPLCGNRRSIF